MEKILNVNMLEKFYDWRTETYDFTDYDEVCFECNIDMIGCDGKTLKANEIIAKKLDVGLASIKCEKITAETIGCNDLYATTIEAGLIELAGDLRAESVKADFAIVDYTISAKDIDIKMIDASEVMCFGDLKALKIETYNVCFAENNLSCVIPCGHNNSVMFCKKGDLIIAGNKMKNKHIIFKENSYIGLTKAMREVEEGALKQLEEEVFEKYFTKTKDGYVR